VMVSLNGSFYAQLRRPGHSAGLDTSRSKSTRSSRRSVELVNIYELHRLNRHHNELSNSIADVNCFVKNS